jgi:hypothetical protein
MTSFLQSWVLKPEYFPAWLQAIAAIVALMIGVWAVWWPTVLSRRRDRTEQRALAVAVYPEISKMRDDIQLCRERLELIVEKSENLLGQNIAYTVQISGAIPICPMLNRSIDRLFILGDSAGLSCITLVRLLTQYNERLANLSACLGAMDQHQWPDAVRVLIERLKLFRESAIDCEHKVRPIYLSAKR